MKRHGRAIGATAAALCLGLAGCQMRGPRTMIVASSHYSDTVRVAGSEQMLVNLVRLRYRHLPVFLAVSSISNQFEFETRRERLSAPLAASQVGGDLTADAIKAGVEFEVSPSGELVLVAEKHRLVLRVRRERRGKVKADRPASLGSGQCLFRTSATCA